MRVIIYTAVFRNYDRVFKVRRLKKKYPDIHFELFTDQSKIVKGWNQHIISPENRDELFLRGRYHKWMFRSFFDRSYDINVWMDGCMHYYDIPLILDHCARLMNSDKDIILPKHPKRTTVKDEIEEIARQKKDDHEIMMHQYKGFVSEGFQDDVGLYENNIVIRKNNSAASRSIGEKVWEELHKGSKRDQVCVPFILWKYHPDALMPIEYDMKVKMAPWKGHRK